MVQFHLQVGKAKFQACDQSPAPAGMAMMKSIPTTQLSVDCALMPIRAGQPAHPRTRKEHHSYDAQILSNLAQLLSDSEPVLRKYCKTLPRFVKEVQKALTHEPSDAEGSEGTAPESSAAEKRPTSLVWEPPRLRRAKPRKVIPSSLKRQRSPSTSHVQSEEEEYDDSETDTEKETEKQRRAPMRDMETIRIGDTEKVAAIMTDYVIAAQQLAIKSVLKRWIKLIEPKKQSNYPYSSSDKVKRQKALKAKEKRTGEKQEDKGPLIPQWWPIDHCRHVEPDHLLKPERIVLMITILRLRRSRGWVKMLKESLDSLSFRYESDKGERGDARVERRKKIISDLCRIAAKEEDYVNGETDADAVVAVPRYEPSSHLLPRSSTKPSSESNAAKLQNDKASHLGREAPVSVCAASATLGSGSVSGIVSGTVGGSVGRGQPEVTPNGQPPEQPRGSLAPVPTAISAAGTASRQEEKPGPTALDRTQSDQLVTSTSNLRIKDSSPPHPYRPGHVCVIQNPSGFVQGSSFDLNHAESLHTSNDGSRFLEQQPLLCPPTFQNNSSVQTEQASDYDFKMSYSQFGGPNPCFPSSGPPSYNSNATSGTISEWHPTTNASYPESTVPLSQVQGPFVENQLPIITVGMDYMYSTATGQMAPSGTFPPSTQQTQILSPVPSCNSSFSSNSALQSPPADLQPGIRSEYADGPIQFDSIRVPHGMAYQMSGAQF